MRTHTSAIFLSIILFYITIMRKQTAITISMNRTNGAVDGEQRMTSVEIAELTGKNHFDVLRAIRKMEPAWENVQRSKFRLSQRNCELPTRRSLRIYTWKVRGVKFNESDKPAIEKDFNTILKKLQEIEKIRQAQ
jgi:hypothetical protein